MKNKSTSDLGVILDYYNRLAVRDMLLTKFAQDADNLTDFMRKMRACYAINLTDINMENPLYDLVRINNKVDKLKKMEATKKASELDKKLDAALKGTIIF